MATPAPLINLTSDGTLTVITDRSILTGSVKAPVGGLPKKLDPVSVPVSQSFYDGYPESGLVAWLLTKSSIKHACESLERGGREDALDKFKVVPLDAITRIRRDFNESSLTVSWSLGGVPQSRTIPIGHAESIERREDKPHYPAILDYLGVERNPWRKEEAAASRGRLAMMPTVAVVVFGGMTAGLAWIAMQSNLNIRKFRWVVDLAHWMGSTWIIAIGGFLVLCALIMLISRMVKPTVETTYVKA